ncbi:aldose 1-epimerase (plasmid) [Pseudoalteromonas nigrifaciens]|uniref:Aldose 1-epimerase n=1 Tax=Pseudoalteromonas nigrifaciens TaxID=28109 RepID=A0AAC9UM04_9GAMM|nr:aldose 1-epimerase [Pseudoalteromonas nigrifaciens]GEN43280.1 aldose 1-epimerase [Pseudoalteromonas nigrifaciens]SJN41245.1 Aldose 1-epimerase [Pseudoalteromonas sp. JB197]SUD25088.1 Aldose 1-epimerase precursor [Pseudoalteromonas nigrifaciens]
MIAKERNSLQSIQLSDGENLIAEIIPFGAIVKSIKFKKQEVTLSVDDLQYYVENPFYLGATIGRYANRIEGGCFNLSGTQYKLAKNNGPNSLHGGIKGFNKVLWEVSKQSANEVELYYCSADGEEGFPGQLQVWQTITANNGQLVLSFKAVSNKETLVNFTNHCYFNLEGSDTIENHLLQVNATHFLPIDENNIPISEPIPVAKSCFDFTQSKLVGSALEQSHPQLDIASGIDHCYVYEDDNSLKLMASLTSTLTNINLTLFSTQPGMQLYTANFVDLPFKARQALCLEAQNWPDAPNKKGFPKANLLPGETYEQVIIYAFS